MKRGSISPVQSVVLIWLIALALFGLGVLALAVLTVCVRQDALHPLDSQEQCKHNLVMLGVALNNYQDECGTPLPPVVHQNGRRVSWRVVLTDRYFATAPANGEDQGRTPYVLRCPFARGNNDDTVYRMITDEDRDAPTADGTGREGGGTAHYVGIIEWPDEPIDWRSTQDVALNTVLDHYFLSDGAPNKERLQATPHGPFVLHPKNGIRSLADFQNRRELLSFLRSDAK